MTKQESEIEMHVLKTASCPTLSGGSKLEYAIGVDPKGHYHLRIVGNDGGGFSSNEWVAWGDILQALQKVEPVTSLPLRNVFIGKSANNAGFLLAVLQHLHVVDHMPGKTLHFVLQDSPGAFLDKLNKPAKQPPAKKPAAKAPAKKTSAKNAPAKKAPSK